MRATRVKLLPALTLSEQDCDWIESSFREVIAESHRVPGAIWSFGMTLAEHARKTHATKEIALAGANHCQSVFHKGRD